MYVDLDAVRLIADGVSHRVRLTRLPVAGEQLTTVCGLHMSAAFDDEPARVVPVPCSVCAELDRSDRAAESTRLRAHAVRVAEPGNVYGSPAGLTSFPAQPQRGLRPPPQRKEITG
ncbi:hypothetical protein [Amycolatopsis sp. NPDC051128]|uniref:hypothetical protein n=1 Tax=Amycolatopsis sp. NPDC051128 TaxID=3155412 RepID=UPI003445E588